MTVTDLDKREGLPDALRALVQEYPRQTWDEHPNFHGLVSFWLDRHMAFRRILSRLGGDTRALLDGGLAHDRYVPVLSRLGSIFVGDLHGHHQIEDYHYFPLLAARDRGLSSGFEILDRDHHALDGHLAGFVAAANGVLSAEGDALRDRAGELLGNLDTLERVMDRHLVDEEEIVVPIILKHGLDGLG